MAFCTQNIVSKTIHLTHYITHAYILHDIKKTLLRIAHACHQWSSGILSRIAIGIALHKFLSFSLFFSVTFSAKL